MSNESRNLGRQLRHTKEMRDRIERNWDIQFSGPEDYEATFKNVLNGTTLRDILERWDPHDVAALDFMGYGQALHELGIQHGLAVALTDAREPERAQAHGDHVNMVLGDVMSSKTWHDMDSWLQAEAPDDKLFKLILARPEGGLSSLPLREDYGYILIDRLYRRLSPQGGEMLVQATDTFDRELGQWSDLLNNTPGLDAAHQTLNPPHRDLKRIFQHMEKHVTSSAIRITKSEGAPNRLPTLPDARYRPI